MKRSVLLGIGLIVLGACGDDKSDGPADDGGTENQTGGDGDSQSGDGDDDQTKNDGPCGKGTYKKGASVTVLVAPTAADEISIDELDGYTRIDTVINIEPGVADLSALGCVEKAEKLSIVGDEIVDLSPLAKLKTITTLEIVGTGLTSLHGLEALESVQNLTINSNDLLPSLEGLASLHMLNSLEIEENDILANIDALSGLTYVDGYLGIADNPMLSSCAVKEIVEGIEVNEEPFVKRNLEDGCQ